MAHAATPGWPAWCEQQAAHRCLQRLLSPPVAGILLVSTLTLWYDTDLVDVDAFSSLALYYDELTSSPADTATIRVADSLCRGWGVDCHGETIARILAASEAECCSFCWGIEGCSAWSWNFGSDKWCHARATCKRPEQSDFVISGWREPRYRRHSQMGPRYCGDSQYIHDGHKGSEEMCRVACSAESTCRFYSYWDTGRCRLTSMCSSVKVDPGRTVVVWAKPKVFMTPRYAEYLSDNRFCSDDALEEGTRTEGGCRGRCSKLRECRFYSFFDSSQCRLTSTCRILEVDGAGSVAVWEKVGMFAVGSADEPEESDQQTYLIDQATGDSDSTGGERGGSSSSTSSRRRLSGLPRRPGSRVTLLHASLAGRFGMNCSEFNEGSDLQACELQCHDDDVCSRAILLCHHLFPRCRTVDMSMDMKYGTLKTVDESGLITPCNVTRRSGSCVHMSRPMPLFASRIMYATGFDAKSRLGMSLPSDPVLTWTTQAEVIFKRHWRAVQFSSMGCRRKAEQDGYTVADVAFDWGVSSVIRDVGDQLLFGLLEGTPVVWGGLGHSTYSKEFDVCANGRFWLEGCYFKNFSNCQRHYDAGRMPGFPLHELRRRVPQVAEDTSWFLARSKPLWDELVSAGAVRVRTCAGCLVEGPAKMPRRLKHMQLLAMFRSLLLRVAFRPNADLRQRVRDVALQSGLSNLSANESLTLVALHVRRTDKKLDFQSSGHDFPQWSLSLSEGPQGLAVLRALIEYLSRRTKAKLGFFLMTDDPRVFQPALIDALFRRPGGNGTWPWASSRPRSGTQMSAAELDMGHEHWSNKPELYLQVLAEAFAAARWSHHVIGAGSSGVSQLVAQLVGARFGVDPNLLSLWEDDPLVMRYIRGRRRRWGNESDEELAMMEALIDPMRDWSPLQAV